MVTEIHQMPGCENNQIGFGNRFTLAPIVTVILFFLCYSSFLLGQAQRPLNPFDLRHIAIDFTPSGARPLAMGGAGIALADDASTTQLNPAGVALFNRPAFSFSTRFRNSESEVPSPTATDFSRQDIFNRSQFDQIFLNVILSYKNLRISSYRETVVDSRLTYTSRKPFLANSMTPDDLLKTNFPSTEAIFRLQVIDNTTSFAVRLGKRFNAGATIRLTRFEYSLSELGFMPSEIANPISQQWEDYPSTDENLYFIRNADERQWGVGTSFGIMAKLNSRMTAGLTYHYRPSFEIKSRTRLPGYDFDFGDGIRFYQAGGTQQHSIRFDLPDSYGIGLAYRYPGYFNGAIDLNRITYSQLLNLGEQSGLYRNLIQNDNLSSATQPDLTLKDQWQLNIGLEYIFKIRFGDKRTRLPIRMGYYRDPAHQIYSNDANPLIQALYPKGKDIHHFGAGMGFFLGDLVRFDSAIHFSESMLEIVVTSVYTF